MRGAEAESGLKLNPHMLRKWFATEMASRGVPAHYIDAFQGRLPKTILARYYTDYSSRRLLQIYKQAGLSLNLQPVLRSY
ncbi:MAG: integrase [Candidatus Hecatellaceae archaeon]